MNLRRLVRQLKVFCFLALIFSVASSAKDYRYIVEKYNNSVASMPFVGAELGGEVIVVTVNSSGGEDQFGFKTNPDGTVNGYSDQPYPNSSVAIMISDNAVQNLQNSPDPLNTFRQLWGTEIQHHGLNIFSSLKLFFYDIGYGIFNFFSPPKPVIISTPPVLAVANPLDYSDIYSGNTVITCAETSPTAGGGVMPNQTADQKNPGPIKQAQNNTCVPNALIWILEHLNLTHPGLVSGNRMEEFRNISSGLIISENGTITGSIPGGIARYINSSGKNSTIRVYGNWSYSNGTWVLNAGNETQMATRNASVVVGGQNVSLVNAADYLPILQSEFNESEGVLILFDQHAVAAVSVTDPGWGIIDVMDPSQGAFVKATLENGELIVYDPTGQVYSQGHIIAIITISPDKLT